MIVPMKHVTLLCVADAREATLDTLRGLDLVHLNIEAADSENFRDAQRLLAANQRAQWALYAAHTGKPVTAAPAAAHHLTPEQAAQLEAWLAQPLPQIEGTSEAKTTAILALAGIRQDLVNETDRLRREIQRVQPFGDFDITLPARLTEQGIPVTLFRAPPGRFPPAPEGAAIQRLSEDPAAAYAVLIGDATLPALCEAVPLPEMRLNDLLAREGAVSGRAAEIEAALKQAFPVRDELVKAEADLKDQCVFTAAVDTMREHSAVVWISGWCPASQTDRLRQTAKDNAWGLLLRDPDATENVPTLLDPPRWLRPTQFIFKGLGISPTYREADVSLPFFIFFSIFFAMLVGDACYGALILALALWGRRKVPPTPAARAPFTLLIVFAAATVVWGALSNSWLGFHPDCLRHPVCDWLSDPHTGMGNTMLLCFTIGVVHLSIARLWNAAVLFPDTKCLAQIGWVGVIWSMYFISGSVVGVLPMPGFMKIVLVVSVLLIALFMLKKHELKTNGADLGMLPLNVIGCLGDIISYVRLFAVGLASVKVAENFNAMATGFDWPLYLKIVPMLIILLLGHGLNFAMACLSVLVHAVRLNTLEFSNHKGITWSGTRFTPFRQNIKDT
ncbi:MAG: hypothetical protein FWG50_11885 [Kiritimatiellaeota bacterium]|nr:hypothetical protein [Kiritimatiellota bacterium]